MKNKGDNTDESRNAQVITILMHFMNFTRPDIAYLVCRLSRYIQNPNESHWCSLNRVMKF